MLAAFNDDEAQLRIVGLASVRGGAGMSARAIVQLVLVDAEAWGVTVDRLAETLSAKRGDWPPVLASHARLLEALAAICDRVLSVGDDAGVTTGQANAIQRVADTLCARLKKIEAGKLSEGALAENLDALQGDVDSFRAHAIHILFSEILLLPKRLAVLTSVAEATRDDVNVLKETPAAVMAELDATLSAAKEQRAATEREYAAGRTALNAALAEAGVGKFAEHFRGLATQHRNEARRWLSSAQWLAGAATLLVVVFTLNVALEMWPTQLEASAACAVLLSIVASITVFCARNYRAHQHNDALNQHRAVALQTFAAFRDSTTDQATKDAILALAAQCAFTGQDTGFGGAVEVVTPVVQALKAKA